MAVADRPLCWCGSDGHPLWAHTRHVCDVAGCEEGFTTMAEVIAHEETHRPTPTADEAKKGPTNVSYSDDTRATDG